MNGLEGYSTMAMDLALQYGPSLVLALITLFVGLWIIGMVTRAVAGASAERLAADDFRVLGVGRDDETPDELADEASDEHPYDGTLRDLERRILVHALETAEGNKSEAARLLGLKRTTFLDKLRRHDLAPQGKRGGQSEAPDAGLPG